MIYEGLMEFTASDFIAIVGSLIGVVAVLYMRNMGIQIEHLREDNEKLWETVGELRGAVQLTRENYVSKKDFDGAVTRIFNKLDLIDGKFMRFLSGDECIKRLREIDDRWRKTHGKRHDD